MGRLRKTSISYSYVSSSFQTGLNIYKEYRGEWCFGSKVYMLPLFYTSCMLACCCRSLFTFASLLMAFSKID
jgi:hypothetical protein